MKKLTLLGLCAEAGHVEEGRVVEEEPVGEAGLVVLAEPPVLVVEGSGETEGRIRVKSCSINLYLTKVKFVEEKYENKKI